MTKKRDFTQELIIIFICLLFCFFWLLALNKTDYIDTNKNCHAIKQNLNLINTEATPERLDLENAYFDM
jgi:hypothetical protein